MRRVLSILLMAVSGPMVLAAAEQTDLAAIKQKALAGDPAAQVQVGMSYALASPRNPKEAIKWFQMAADQGYPDGEYRLGGMLDVGITPQNPTEAIKWYTKAADQGYKDAQFRLAVMYDRGRGVSQSYSEAAKWYTKAGEQGHPEAQYRLGVMYEEGKGVPQDYSLAMKWYLKAAAGKFGAGAEYKIGTFYEHGYGVPKSRDQAIAWYQKSDKHGDVDAGQALRALEQQ